MIPKREKKDIQILSDDKELNPDQYIAWIYPYLYYFSHKFDNRENIPKEDKIKINGKSDIMLVPIGAKNPTIFPGIRPFYATKKCLQCSDHPFS